MFAGSGGSVLVDCGGSPIQKLLRAGVDPRTLARVVITHIHADHAYGLPSLVQGLRLMGRIAPLPISCREEHAASLRELLRLFRLIDRPDMYPVDVVAVPAGDGAPVATAAGFRITAAPNAHGNMANMALRFDGFPNGAVVYSSDTEPCDAVVALARGADILIHEATYSAGGLRGGAHSTAAEAALVAARAGVRRLILVHVDPAHHANADALADEARANFGGAVEVARELVDYRP